MRNFRGTTVAITGAGSGIGRALAIDLAQRGASLAISDVDDAGLAETVGLCEGHAVKVTSQHLDVADRDAMFAWADAVADQHDGVNMDREQCRCHPRRPPSKVHRSRISSG